MVWTDAWRSRRCVGETGLAVGEAAKERKDSGCLTGNRASVNCGREEPDDGEARCFDLGEQAGGSTSLWPRQRQFQHSLPRERLKHT